jgi:hypothetical protein
MSFYRYWRFMMDFSNDKKARWQRLLILFLAVLMLVACGSKDEEAALPEGCDGVTWGSAVEVEERDGEYYAIVRGDFPDSCSTICGIEQEVKRDTININLYSERPQDLVCSSMLTPFVEEVLLDTEGLDPGVYTVTINRDHASTTFTLE